MSNHKTLYNGDFSHTPEARNLAFQATESVKKLIEESLAQGYSPHEIEQVICSGIHQHICRLIIDLRREGIEQRFRLPPKE